MAAGDVNGTVAAKVLNSPDLCRRKFRCAADLGMCIMYGVQLGLELGSLRGVVPKLSLEMGALLLSYCQLAAQAGLAPLKALHMLPTTQTVFFQDTSKLPS